ncbi:MAG: CsgG/HfaB family protein [Gemmatimonadales bacterium]
MRLRTQAYVVATVIAAPSLAGQDLPTGIAVLAFQDGGSYGQDQDDFAALERGIPGMLVSELSLHPDARLADRSETQRILQQQDLGESGHVNAVTAADIGRLVGADYVVFGTFVDLYGKFRIDARIVDVETGKIIHVATASDDRENLFRVVQALAQEILADLEFPPLSGEIETGRAGRNVPTDAVTFYSRALWYQDQGETSRAVEFYRRALEVFPDYHEAQEGLRGIR